MTPEETRLRLDLAEAIGFDLLLAHGEVDHESDDAIRLRMDLILMGVEGALAGKAVVVRRPPPE